MSIPKHQDVRLPLLNFFQDGAVHTLKECTAELASFFKLTDEDRNILLSKTRTRWYDRVYWAKTHLNKAGLIESVNRGEFMITKEGKQMLNQNLFKIEDANLEKYSGYVEFLKRSGKQKTNLSDYYSNESSVVVLENIYEKSANTPYEIIEDSFNELNTVLTDELLEKLKVMDFFQFEDIVLDLLIKLGYGGSKDTAKQNTTRTSDGGIDGIINADRLGLNKIFVQAKRWKDTVIGRPEVQKFAGALDGFGGNNGIFITTSFFSKDAIKYVGLLPNKNIVLIDGKELAQYMFEVGMGVSVEKVYEVKKLDLDYFIK